MSAEVAAGVYFEERRGLVATLWRLLQVMVLGAEEQPPEVLAVTTAFTLDLLAARTPEGRSALVSRLLDLIQVHCRTNTTSSAGLTAVMRSWLCDLRPDPNCSMWRLLQDESLEPAAGSRLTCVVDAHGSLVERHVLLQKERTLLTECLVYAVCIEPRIPPQVRTCVCASPHITYSFSWRLRMLLGASSHHHRISKIKYL